MTRHYLYHASTWNTTDADLDAALDAVPGILGDLR